MSFIPFLIVFVPESGCRFDGTSLTKRPMLIGGPADVRVVKFGVAKGRRPDVPIPAVSHSDIQGGEDVDRELSFSRRNRRRMGHKAISDASCSIGSGASVSFSKNLLQQRMTHCGHNRGKKGGQAVPSFRSPVNMSQFDGTYRSLIRCRQTNALVKPRSLCENWPLLPDSQC